MKFCIDDLLGHKVAQLVNGNRLAGVYDVTFDGSYLAPGICICNQTVGNYKASGKLVLMK